MFSRSLIRIFSGCMFDREGCKVSSCEQERARRCADTWTNLSLRWTNTSEGTFSNVATDLTEAEWNKCYIDLNYSFPPGHYIQGMSLESAMCHQTCKQKKIMTSEAG